MVKYRIDQEKSTLKRAITFVGVILIGFAIFAKQLGIDNDDGWGTGRIVILLAGLALIAAALTVLRNPEQSAKLLRFVVRNRQVLLAALIVAVIYIWVSQINVKYLRTGYHYYGQLASSFRKAQLHLQQQPSDALLSLANPYDYDLRVEKQVEDFPWDVSLYREKFYLYYGPAPALLISVLSPKMLSQIEDRHIVLVFAFGVFIYETLILLKFLARSVPQAPGWLAGISVLALGLTAPTAIMLQESKIYQAAVFGSQFFFIGGCYWLYSAITEERPNRCKLVLTGLHWALALGTRSAIAPVILYSTVITAIGIHVVYRLSVRDKLISIFSVGAPLGFAVVSIALYNYARFDSIFEFGLKYTLTNMNYLTSRNVFATSHIGPNFYNYFLHPLRLSSHFPFLNRIEYVFSSERLGGLFYISPYILFALLPAVSYEKSIAERERLNAPPAERRIQDRLLMVLFAGAAIIGAITVHLFWTTEMRYIEDFMPSLLLLATANAAVQHHRLASAPGWRSVLSVLIVLLAGITIVASTLVALKSNSLDLWVNLYDSLLRILNLK